MGAGLAYIIEFTWKVLFVLDEMAAGPTTLEKESRLKMAAKSLLL